MQIKPFFINSNICLEQNDISSFEKFMAAIAGNTGNSYITYALIKELFGGLVKIRHIQNIYEYNFDNSDIDIDYINNEATHVFLILQDQIRISESYGLKLPYKKIMDFISKVNKSVIVAGLGANSFEGFDNDFHKKLDPNLINFLKFLADHCIEIGVRGHFTQEVLHKIGINNVNAIGCPSFYEMGRNRIIIKKEINDLKSVVLSQRLILHTPKIHKIMQDFQEQDVIQSIAFNTIGNNLSQEQIECFYNQTYHIFSNIKEWKNWIKQYKFAIGNRMHGSILAINSGVPALCMNGDSRATEMCQLMKIPHNSNLNISNENQILKIYDELDCSELNNTYPSLYNNFLSFLHKNNLCCYDENNELINTQEYIEQPSLKLYGNYFYGFLDNKIYLSQIKETQNIIQNVLNDRLSKTSFLQQIFSVKNENFHKIIRILGMKIRLRRKDK